MNGSFNALHLSCTVDYIRPICVNGFVDSIRTAGVVSRGPPDAFATDKMTMNVCS